MKDFGFNCVGQIKDGDTWHEDLTDWTVKVHEDATTYYYNIDINDPKTMEEFEEWMFSVFGNDDLPDPTDAYKVNIKEVSE